MSKNKTKKKRLAISDTMRAKKPDESEVRVRVWAWIPILYPNSTHTRPLLLFNSPTFNQSYSEDLRFEVPASKNL